MKKVGQFFFTFVPFLLVIAIQIFATFFLMAISSIVGGGLSAFVDTNNSLPILDTLMYFWISQSFNTGVMLIYLLLTTVFFGIWYYTRYGGNYLPAPMAVFHPLTFLGIVLLVPGMQYLCSYITSFVSAFFPQWLDAYLKLLESAGISEKISVTVLLYSVVLAPICEELVFRGVTMRQARKSLPFWAANIFQAILFGIFHMNMIQGIYTFFIGLVLGLICEKSGSIYNAILYHMLFNFWGAVLSPYMTFGESNFSLLFWFVFSLVMTIGGLLFVSKGSHHAQNQMGKADTII